MTILAITPYTGSEKLVKMTESMLASLITCLNIKLIDELAGGGVQVTAVNNAAVRPQSFPLLSHYHMDENVGFGNAINLAIQREIIEPPKMKTVHIESGRTATSPMPMDFTHVLILNNDLQFPDENWLRELLQARQGNLILSPCTNVTATKEAVASGARDLDPIRHREVSAFCWLVPVPVIHALRKKFGFPLFHPDFTNYGSDDVTAACLRSLYGPTPFKIVPRSFVKHLKAQTANELGVKAGTPELLRRITNFKRSRRLT